MKIHRAFEIYWRQESGKESDTTEYYRRDDVDVELSAAVARAETAEAERDSLATRVDHLEQCAYTQDPNAPLTWEGMQLIAAEKSAECKRLAAKLARVLDGLKPKGDCPLQVNSHSWYQWVGWYDAHARAVAIAEGTP